MPYLLIVNYLGFSLLELLVSLSLIAILSSWVIPGYNSLVYQARRSDATSSLLALQLAVERYRLSCSQYPTRLDNQTTCDSATSAQADGLHSLKASDKSIKAYYQLQLQVNNASITNAYRLVASSTGVQTADERCAHFFLDQSGQKTATDSQGQSHDDCW